MAKFGEGDSRWIVSERQDGTNVGAWHWSEKNLDEWCKHRLNELFADVEILSAAEGGMSARTTGLVSCTGEAFANIRKGKVIPAYELEVKIGYSGAIVDGEGNEVARSSGTVLFPYVSYVGLLGFNRSYLDSLCANASSTIASGSAHYMFSRKKSSSKRH